MKSDWISSFFDGLQSVVKISEIAKGMIASAVADGVESGFNRITSGLVKLFTVLVLLLTGLLMFALGLSDALESIFHSAGLGHLLTGIVFIAAGAIYYQSRR
jgi:SNF family Na+-dependent transporter